MRKATMSVLLAAACCCPRRLSARRLSKGVTFPDTATVGGRECRLDGVGVRKKVVISVYLGALYLATPTDDAAAAIAADEPKRVVMHFVHSKVGADEMREAWRDGFDANSAATLPQLKERLERFSAGSTRICSRASRSC